MSLRTIAILQARINSTRLHGKIMLPLLGRPMIEQIYTRVSRATTLNRVIVAIPKGTWNDMREAVIPFNDFFLFDGDENDLVARYLACATLHQADVIVRIPCDNPCVDPASIDKAVQWYREWGCTFLSNTTDRVHGQWLDGVGAEVFSRSRLQWLEEKTRGHPEWREHPHRYFYERGGSSTIFTPGRDEKTFRLDVNTQADYDFINSIYDHFQRNDFTATEIVASLESMKVSS